MNGVMKEEDPSARMATSVICHVYRINSVKSVKCKRNRFVLIQSNIELSLQTHLAWICTFLVEIVMTATMFYCIQTISALLV